MKPRWIPALPTLVAALFLLWREVAAAEKPETPPPPGAASARRAGVIPPPRSGVRCHLAPSSVVRFRAGTDSTVVRLSATSGSLQLDSQGWPQHLSLDVDLRFLEQEPGGPARGLARNVLGVRSGTRMTFTGIRQDARYTRVPGVAEITFAGTVEVGGAVQHAIVAARVVSLDSDGIRLVARTTALASRYGLPGRRAFAPFAREEPLTVVWDLAFEAPSR